jgi:hypothetical protein
MLVRAVKIKDIIDDTIYQHKDIRLIPLLLDEEDWKLVEILINVLKPLKEVTLLTSRNSESLCVTNVLPLFHYCLDCLKDTQKEFAEGDDIYGGIESSVEKLTHNCDKISPMVGISLILNPSMKKSFLKTALGWEKTWIDTVMDSFKDSYYFYKQKVVGESLASEEARKTEIDSLETGYSNFLKRKRNGSRNETFLGEEFDRYNV